MRQLSKVFRSSVAPFVLTGCLAGCGGGYDSSPEKFQQGVTSQFDQMIEKVKADPDLSDGEKEFEIAKVEEQRQAFAGYVGNDPSQGQ